MFEYFVWLAVLSGACGATMLVFALALAWIVLGKENAADVALAAEEASEQGPAASRASAKTIPTPHADDVLRVQVIRRQPGKTTPSLRTRSDVEEA